MSYLPRSITEYLRQSYVSLTLAGIMLWVFLLLQSFEGERIDALKHFNTFQANEVLNGDIFLLVSWVFVHADAIQLLFSLLAMVIISANLERIMGPIRYAAFFLLSSVLTGLVLLWVHVNIRVIDLYLYGVAPAIAAAIAALVFTRVIRPQWFDDTDLRVLWVFTAAYVVVILGGFAHGFNSPTFAIVYGTGLVLGLGLSPLLMPRNRFDG